MRHPTDGTLRRLLDEPAGVADAERDHVAHCSECLAGLAAVRSDAVAVGSALGAATDVDVDAAWHRLSRSLTVDAPPRSIGAAPSRRRTGRLRSPVVAALGAVALVTGASAAAAADWLQIFRAEQVAPVSFTQADVMQLPDLSAFGDLEIPQGLDFNEVPDAAAAEEATGLPAPKVDDLPRGVTGEPTYEVSKQVRAVFTFSADDATEVAGRSSEPLPAGLDGASFRLTGGPGMAAVWTEARGVPALVVARAFAPTVESSGVPFETARDYLLSLPGLPDDVAAQLRGLTGDATTLPLPIPSEYVETSETDVDDAPATLLRSRDGTFAAVVWVEDGVVNAVGGSLSTDEVLQVARGLQ